LAAAHRDGISGRKQHASDVACVGRGRGSTGTHPDHGERNEAETENSGDHGFLLI
jgi:hypothetical protein